jgi:lysozyme family protein
MKYGAKWGTLAKQWDRMRVNSARVNEVDRAAQRAFAHKDRYKAVEDVTGVPWWLIAGLHMREADFNFHTYMGNGEPLNRRTRLVPRGRGPFPSWEAGAIDALKYDGLSSVIDWRIEKALWMAEKYNGLGYENRALPSPYVFGGTNVQRAGKYVADGRWSSSTWDRQLGVAPVFQRLAEIDPTIEFTRED